VATRSGWSYFCKNDHFRQAGTFWGPFEDAQIFNFFSTFLKIRYFDDFFIVDPEGPQKFLPKKSAKISLVEISDKKIGRADFYRNFRPFSSFGKKMEFSPMQ